MKIYVATHDPEKYPPSIIYPYYIPIYCGKALSKIDSDILGDDTGDNISLKNPNYCELTGLYWIWKNGNDDDILGLNHYRRYFREPNRDRFLTEETASKILNKYDFIVREEEIPTLVYSHYGSYHYSIDLDNTLKAIKIYYPDLYETIKYKILTDNILYSRNMFITNKKHFDDYCNFLFTVLKYVESVTDLNDGNHDDYNVRVFGFIGERLLRPWIVANNYTSKPLECIEIMGAA